MLTYLTRRRALASPVVMAAVVVTAVVVVALAIVVGARTVTAVMAVMAVAVMAVNDIMDSLNNPTTRAFTSKRIIFFLFVFIILVLIVFSAMAYVGHLRFGKVNETPIIFLDRGFKEEMSEITRNLSETEGSSPAVRTLDAYEKIIQKSSNPLVKEIAAFYKAEQQRIMSSVDFYDSYLEILKDGKDLPIEFKYYVIYRLLHVYLITGDIEQVLNRISEIPSMSATEKTVSSKISFYKTVPVSEWGKEARDYVIATYFDVLAEEYPDFATTATSAQLDFKLALYKKKNPEDSNMPPFEDLRYLGEKNYEKALDILNRIENKEVEIMPADYVVGLNKLDMSFGYMRKIYEKPPEFIQHKQFDFFEKSFVFADTYVRSLAPYTRWIYAVNYMWYSGDTEQNKSVKIASLVRPIYTTYHTDYYPFSFSKKIIDKEFDTPKVIAQVASYDEGLKSFLLSFGWEEEEFLF